MDREVTDAEGTVWNCVQAFAGLGEQSGAAQAAAEKMAEKLGGGEGQVASSPPRGAAPKPCAFSCPRTGPTLDDEALAGAIADARAAADG
jgi:hypothetical protein